MRDCKAYREGLVVFVVWSLLMLALFFKPFCSHFL